MVRVRKVRPLRAQRRCLATRSHLINSGAGDVVRRTIEFHNQSERQKIACVMINDVGPQGPTRLLASTSTLRTQVGDYAMLVISVAAFSTGILFDAVFAYRGAANHQRRRRRPIPCSFARRNRGRLRRGCARLHQSTNMGGTRRWIGASATAYQRRF